MHLYLIAKKEKVMIVKNKNIILRKIYKSYFLIDITENYLNDECSLIEINDIGKFIWEEIDANGASGQIARKLKKVTVGAVDVFQIESDVDAFLQMLYKLKFVRMAK